ncbi:MAG: LysM peptidoglycan-binding domain-containing protein [Actinobacteria bacterium]|nr:MAG: LysM peptidoglycan-binding domain-containing protein [Actinomycetota bacterium]
MFGRVMILALLGVFLWAVFARSSGATGPARHYEVRGGDTLWSIATANYGGDPRAAVWKIEKRNHLEGAAISPGQVLLLPL